MVQAIFPDTASFHGPAYFAQSVHLGQALDQTGQLSFYNSSSALPTLFQAGNTTASITYTWPTAGPVANNYLLASSTVGVLSWLNAAGTYAPIGSAFVTIGSDATLTAERALTGTSNQVVVTDNGAGSTVVLSTPQNIHTAATPTFAGETISASQSGSDVALTVQNTSNTASSGAVLNISTAGSSAFDPYIRFTGAGATFNTWVAGADLSDTMNFKIMRASTLGTSPEFQIKDSNGAVSFLGTNTNDAAAAGYVGEVINSKVLFASRSAMTTGTSANVTSITLTAGDWDLSGAIAYLLANTTIITGMVASVSTTTGTLSASTTYAAPNTSGEYRTEIAYGSGTVLKGDFVNVISIPRYSIKISSTVTFYLVANATFTVAALETWGFIEARRAR